MKIAIGADHRGFAHKELLMKTLAAQAHTLVDVGKRWQECLEAIVGRNSSMICWNIEVCANKHAQSVHVCCVECGF